MCLLFFGVCQEVISALRGTGQEVTLHLCRPAPGVLPEMDPAIKVRPLVFISLMFIHIHVSWVSSSEAIFCLVYA